jgi:hypothetical protein
MCQSWNWHSKRAETPFPCYDYGVINQKQMTTSQRMEKQFFLHFIRLVDEVQGKEKLKSQFHSSRKMYWMKQITNPRQKTDSLSRV